MGPLELFITACVPVLNMLLVTGVGSFLASDFAGVLTKEARKHLNNLVFYVFNPCLIATYLARTITMESLGKLWFMPVNILLTFIFGLIFGSIMLQITRAPVELKGIVLACCSAGNYGNIFLIIIPALCKEKGSPFGSPDVCRTYGLAYSSLSLAIGAVFLWSIAYNIVRVTSQVSEGDGDSQTNQTQVLVSGGATGPISSKDKCSTFHTNECTLPLVSADIPPNKYKVHLSERASRFLSSISGALDLKKLFAPPTIAAIVGLILGATPLIKNALIGESAPLRALQDSAELIGGAAVPSVALIMGGNVLKGARGRASVPPPVVAGVVVVRYVLLPLVGTALVKGAVRVGLVQPDPLYQFVLLLQYAVPPAMNIGTMTQLFGAGESECAVIFVWAYALTAVAVTAWSAFFLWTLSSPWP